MEKEETHLKLLYEANITLLPEPDKCITRELNINTAHEHRCKNPQEILANRISDI